MIVSIENKDFGYEVYLNDARLKHCVRADDEKGVAEVYKRKDGDFVISDGDIVCETLTGRVRIEKMKC